MDNFVNKSELQEAIAKLDDRFLTKQTFETLLDHIKNEIVNGVKNDLIAGDHQANIEIVKLAGVITELKNRLDRQANRSDNAQVELNDIKLLLTSLATSVDKYNHDMVIALAELERQKQMTKDTDNHSKRLEEEFDDFKRQVSGNSAKGQPATLQERTYELEVARKEHEYRIMQLEKSSPRNFELAQRIKEQNEILSFYSLFILIFAKVSYYIKSSIVFTYSFLNDKRKEIYAAIVQSLLIRLLIFLVGMLASSPIWVKFVEKFVELLMK